jgi:hypothetical protein
MKFTLSLLAALLGVVSAAGHNGTAGNGTDPTTAVVSGSVTQAPTVSNYYAFARNGHTLKRLVTLKVTLPSDVTVDDIEAVNKGKHTVDYKEHYLKTGCPTSPPAEKLVCDYINVIEHVFKTGSKTEKPHVMLYKNGIYMVEPGPGWNACREGGTLKTAGYLQFPVQGWWETQAERDAALKTLEGNYQGWGFLEEFKAAAVSLGVEHSVTEAQAYDRSADWSDELCHFSAAFEMGVSALALVFSALSLF